MYLANLLIGSILLAFFYILIGSKLFKKDINFKNKITIISIISLLIIMPILSTTFDSFLRTLLTFITMVTAFRFIFNESLYKTFLVVVFIYLYYFVAEVIFSLILIFGLRVEATELVSNWKGYFWTDGIISTIAFGLSCIKPIENYFKKAINQSNKPNHFEIYLVIILGIGVFGSKNGINLGLNAEYISNLILIFVFSFITFHLIKEKERSTQLAERYDQSFKYIEKYEKDLTEKSLYIHEFKNQLAVIKGLVDSENKDLVNYINTIVKDLRETSSSSLRGMENIPKGGLKGLIYYKLSYLEEEGISTYMNINKNIQKCPFSKIDNKQYKDILIMLGVYLDNAIEAASIANKKEVILEMYYEKNIFNFIVSNTFSGKIDTSMLGIKGYSTKGKGRGYGLLLVNGIATKYKNISQKRELTNEYYTQSVSINFKNIPKK